MAEILIWMRHFRKANNIYQIPEGDIVYHVVFSQLVQSYIYCSTNFVHRVPSAALLLNYHPYLIFDWADPSYHRHDKNRRKQEHHCLVWNINFISEYHIKVLCFHEHLRAKFTLHDVYIYVCKIFTFSRIFSFSAILIQNFFILFTMIFKHKMSKFSKTLNKFEILFYTVSASYSFQFILRQFVKY